MLPKIPETRGAKTQRNSQLFSPQVYGTGRGRWLYAFLRYLEEVIFASPRTEPRENTCVQSLGFWSAGSGRERWPSVGRSQGLLPSFTTRWLTSSGGITPDTPAELARPAQRPSVSTLHEYRPFPQVSQSLGQFLLFPTMFLRV